MSNWITGHDEEMAARAQEEEIERLAMTGDYGPFPACAGDCNAAPPTLDLLAECTCGAAAIRAATRAEVERVMAKQASEP